MIDQSTISNKYPKQQAERIIVKLTSTVDTKVHSPIVKPGDLCEILTTIPEDADIRNIVIEVPEGRTFSIVTIEFNNITIHENKPASSVTIKEMDTKE